MSTTTIAGRGPNDSTVEVAVDADGKLMMSGDITIGDITLDNVEISNDVGNPVPVTGPLTDTQLRASDVKVSLDGESVTVTGALTDTQLRATAVPVSGPLTDTQLRATAVPVSGPLTDTQLRATAVPVSAAALPLPDGAATSAQIGEVQASPTANTVLDRLKSLATLLSGGLPAALTSGGGVKTGLVDAVPAGTNSIGAVASNSVLSSATVTRPADTTAYAAKDVISTAVGAVIEFSGMARSNGGTGTIVKARLMTNQSTNTAQYRLHLFHASPTAIADNAQYTMLDVNKDKRIGSIDFPAATTEGTGSDAAATMRPSSDGSYPPPNLWYKCAVADTKLYGLLETIGAFTPASAQTFFIELGADGLS